MTKPFFSTDFFDTSSVLADIEKWIEKQNQYCYYISHSSANTCTNYNVGVRTEKKDDTFLMHIPIIGREKDEIEVTIELGKIRVKTICEPKNPVASYCDFLYSVPESVDVDSAISVFNNGVLTLTFKNKAVKKVEIK